jgi:hypothetical protein
VGAVVVACAGTAFVVDGAAVVDVVVNNESGLSLVPQAAATTPSNPIANSRPA